MCDVMTLTTFQLYQYRLYCRRISQAVRSPRRQNFLRYCLQMVNQFLHPLRIPSRGHQFITALHHVPRTQVPPTRTRPKVSSPVFLQLRPWCGTYPWRDCRTRVGIHQPCRFVNTRDGSWRTTLRVGRQLGRLELEESPRVG